MITYVNSSNAGRYSALFADATAALREAGKLENNIAITTLE